MTQAKPDIKASQEELGMLYSALNRLAYSSLYVYGFNVLDDHAYRLHPARSANEKVLESILLSPELASAISAGGHDNVKLYGDSTYYFLTDSGEGKGVTGYALVLNPDQIQSCSKNLKAKKGTNWEKLDYLFLKEIEERNPHLDIKSSEAKNLSCVVNKLANILYTD
jgi:hypothetical protein